MKIIPQSLSVSIIQFNERCSSNDEKQIEKLELMCYSSTQEGVINWRQFHMWSLTEITAVNVTRVQDYYKVCVHVGSACDT